jgi:hypothetical protein
MTFPGNTTISGNFTVVNDLTVSGGARFVGNITGEANLIIKQTGLIENIVTSGTISGTSGVYTNLSGASITGDLISGTSGVFTALSGASITGDLISGTSGVFTYVSGTNVTGNTISGTSGVFTNLSGATITGDTIQATSGFFVNFNSDSLTVSSGIFASGTESAPSITFSGDLNTGIYSPVANEIGITTDGTGRLFVDSNGNVGIGTSSPANLLQIQGDATFEQNAGGQFAIRGSTNSQNRFNFGFDTTNNYAWLQAITSGTAQRPIALNPSGGNVGIGTSDPGAALHIVSSGQTVSNINTSLNINALVTDNGGSVGNGGSLVFGAASGSWRFAAIKGIVQNGGNNSRGDLAFSTRRNTTDSTLSESMRIDSNGNVGIGTSSPGANLEIKSSANTELRISDTAGGYGSLTYNESGTVSIFNIAADPANTSTPSTAMTFGVDGSERMRIDSSGNVGIGTNTPQHVLDVLSPNSNTDETVAAFGNKTIQGGLEVITNGNLEWGFNAKNSRNLVFETNQTEHMRITSSGNVGIGTISPDALLKLQAGDSNIPANSFAVRQNNGADTSQTTFSIEISPTDGVSRLISSATSAPKLAFYTQGNEAMRIDSNGNVGIGTSDPQGLLDLRKINATGEGATIAIRNTGSGIGTSVSLYLAPNNGGGDDLVRSAAIKSRQTLLGNYADLGFFTANSDTPVERITIVPNGNVGIGTTGPSDSLEVNGNLRFSSAGQGIKFADHAAGNVLDDYEEGTWTPTVIGQTTAGTVTYATRQGYYTKIGNQVTIQLYVVWNSGTGGAGALRVSGLPFTSAANTTNSFVGAVMSAITTVPTNATVYANVTTNSSEVQINNYVAPGAANTTTWSASGAFGVTISYFVS